MEAWQDRMNNVCNFKCKHWRLECVVTNKVMRKLTGGTAHFLKLRSFLSVVIYRQLHAHTCCRWTPFCSKVRNRDKLRLYLCQIGARVSTADLANQAVKHWRRGCRAGVTEIFSRLMYVNREACKSMIHLWSSDGTEELPDKIDESDAVQVFLTFLAWTMNSERISTRPWTKNWGPIGHGARFSAWWRRCNTMCGERRKYNFTILGILKLGLPIW